MTGLGASLNAETLRRWQLCELGKTIEYASDNSGFYNEKLRGVASTELSRYSDLERLPFTTASELRERGDGMLATGLRDVSRIVTMATSGTTGAKKRIFFTEEDEERTVDFFAWGMRDVAPPDSLTLVLLASRTPGGVGDLLARGLERTGRRALLAGAIADTGEAVELFRESRPQCVVGTPSQLHKLASLTDADFVSSVLLSADYVPLPVKRGIASRWCCEVFEHYGMTESCFGAAVECHAHDGMHIRESDLLFEIVDHESGRQLPLGESGEIVFSTLGRRGMPLIRYRTGDRGRLIADGCPCGSILPRLAHVDGRYDNDIRLPALNETISIHVLDELLFSFDGLLDYEASMDGENLHIMAELSEPSRIGALSAFLRKKLLVSHNVSASCLPFYRGTGKRRIIIDI